MARTFASYMDATKEMHCTNTPGKIGPPIAKVKASTVVTNQNEGQKTPATIQNVSTPSTRLSPVPMMGGYTLMLHPGLATGQ